MYITQSRSLGGLTGLDDVLPYDSAGSLCDKKGFYSLSGHFLQATRWLKLNHAIGISVGYFD
jgi:hypothetical protein